MKHFAKIMVGAVMSCSLLSACASSPYEYEDMPNIDNSIVVVETGFLKDTYGYYQNGELNKFGECMPESFLGRYECVSEDEVRVLSYEIAKNDDFALPRLTIDNVEYELVCDTDSSNGVYCVPEEDVVKK